ncbi:hypothetical protein GQ600_24316 [Phytophthora cactorum]|nr:hypothetical protein GQ600_24316 [Phytophthora cactorum]
MVKLTGSTHYNMVEVNRLLELVEEHLPLDKDEWERLATAYNATGARDASSWCCIALAKRRANLTCPAYQASQIGKVINWRQG